MVFMIAVNTAHGQFPADAVVISPAPGTSVHNLLTIFGKAVVRHTPVQKWTVQPLGGPEVWLPMMKEGKCHFANHSVPEVYNAYQGRGVYDKTGPGAVRTVAAGHSTMFMFWTTPETSISSIEDLRGKKVFVKYKTNPLFLDMAQKQLGSAGLSLSDLKSVLAFSNLSVARKALVEGWADAILFPAVPEAVAEINRVKGECRFVALSREQAQYVVSRTVGYHIEDIPANDSRFGNRSEVPNAVCYQNAMFCPPALSAEMVFAVTKAILEHSRESSGENFLAKYWSLDYRPIALAVPYHEGAIQYFKEKGAWTPEAQAYQEKVTRRRKP